MPTFYKRKQLCAAHSFNIHTRSSEKSRSDKSSDGVVITDSKCRIQFINHNLAERLGYTVSEVVGKHIGEFVYKNKFNIPQQKIKQHRYGSTFQFNLPVVCKDGNILWLLVSVTPIFDRFGQYNGSIDYLLDVYPPLPPRLNGHLLSAALEAISDSVLIIDCNCTIIWCNGAFRELSGYNREEIIGESFRVLLPEQDKKTYNQLCLQIENGLPWHTKLISQHKNGKTYQEEMSVTPVNTLKQYFVIVKRDISDQLLSQKAQQQLVEKCEKLAIAETRAHLSRELHDSVSQLLYSTTVLAETGKRLIDQHEDAKLKQNQENIYQASRQALREIRLLVYELRPKELESNGFTNALRRRLDSVERRAGINPQLNLKNSITIPQNIERELFFISQEALNNVVKHSQANHVWVTLSDDDLFLTLEIEDDGVGINHARTDTGGIGLDSMKERAAQIGAEIDINETLTPCCGTRVSLRIPLSKML